MESEQAPELPLAKPIPPRKPEPYECCGTGCFPCVLDIYEEQLQRYEHDLTAWIAQQQSPPVAPTSEGDCNA